MMNELFARYGMTLLLLLSLFAQTMANILHMNTEKNDGSAYLQRIQRILQAKQVAYVYEDADSFGEYALGESAKSLINLNAEPLVSLDYKYELVVITTNTAKTLVDYFELVKSGKLFSANEKYLIAIIGKEDEFAQAFEVLWKFRIKRVIVMDGTLDLHTTNLYKDNCVHANRSRFLFAAEHLRSEVVLEAYYKMEERFSGCRFRVGLAYNPPGTVKFNQTKPGSEIESFMLFARTHNLSITYDTTTFYNSTKTVDNHYANSLRKIYDRVNDAHFSMCNGDQQYYDDFATSTYWVKAQFTLIVPKARRVHTWKGVVSVFSLNLWLLIVGVFCVVTLTAHFFGVFSGGDFAQPAMQTFCILLGKGAKQPASLYCRILFLSWTVTAFLILSSYESKLFSFLTQPTYEDQVDSVDKLVESGWKVIGHGKYINMINSTRPILRARYVNDSNINLSLPNVTNHRNVALYGVLDNVLYHLTNEDARRIYVLNVWSTTFTRMLAVKGFPLFEQFDAFLLRLWQSGILSILMDKYKPMKFDVEDKSFHKGGLDSLFIVFYVYLIGLLVSTLVFLYEFCVKRGDRYYTANPAHPPI